MWNKKADSSATILIIIILIILAFLLFKSWFCENISFLQDTPLCKGGGGNGGNGGAYCGDGNIDAGEQCDGSNLGGKTCVDLGYDSGTLACSSDCTFDTSGCEGAPAESAQFEVNIDKQLFTLVDGQKADKIAFKITIENTGDVDFSDINLYDAKVIWYSQYGPPRGSCTTDGFIQALKDKGMWGSWGPLAKGQSLTNTSGKIVAEDCRNDLDTNQLKFMVKVKGTSAAGTVEKHGYKNLLFQKENTGGCMIFETPKFRFQIWRAPYTFGECQWGNGQMVFNDYTPSTTRRVESGDCYTFITSDDYSVSSSKDYCYEFIYFPGDTADRGSGDPAKVNKDGFEWSDVDIPGWVGVNTRSGQWELNELYKLQCGYQEYKNYPIMLSTCDVGDDYCFKCLKGCARDEGGSDSYTFNRFAYKGYLYCVPHSYNCNSGEYGKNCVTQCYGEKVYLSLLIGGIQQKTSNDCAKFSDLIKCSACR